jgi:hypothetical protein
VIFRPVGNYFLKQLPKNSKGHAIGTSEVSRTEKSVDIMDISSFSESCRGSIHHTPVFRLFLSVATIAIAERRRWRFLDVSVSVVGVGMIVGCAVLDVMIMNGRKTWNIFTGL